ncbi:uncharacterized protein NESG_00645 [Nematocida ausubeli]|uniref:CMGC/CDK/CRK7 protein kinase n=1 Tax=Nematocida ausubeli (strain ATCC PRA-371 / ERTm2) TaxID=1913371 RepID=H8ZA41_NEMA1|nr:uncharacterized protein NESG_00645 [Nematocida ausubeli]EHY66822.1 CMGC/CDK/CRK7 protein kinase [Nematocida ausubeli]KAI5132951.1 hypothetical protein NEAUS06_0446 [Nematocida ausubeli]KFG26498.1 hypothetical protein NESG_00645 [Nematocida ausubeli]
MKNTQHESRYKIQKKIGEGTFGKVYSAVDLIKNKRVAMKKIKLEKQQNGVPVELIREISILKALSHRNLIKVLDTFVKDHEEVHNLNRSSYSIFLVFPYARMDLAKVMKEKTLSQEEILSYAKQILKGLQYMHSRHVIHRDIKPSNILVLSNKCVKIADFGLSRTLSKISMTQGVVTRWYRPPELLMCATRYDASVDIWALGCVIAEMLWKRPLFMEGSDVDQMNAIGLVCGEIDTSIFLDHISDSGLNPVVFRKGEESKIPEMFKEYNPTLFKLITGMMKIHPKRRLTAQESLKIMKKAGV